MDQRKGDPRIYIVTLLFLLCIVSGGILLGLYLLLSDPNPLFLQAGMVFAGVPWLFWFLAYVYTCVLKPCMVSVCRTRSVADFDPEKAEEKNNKSFTKNATSASDPVAEKIEPCEGEKNVQFGNVVVPREEEDKDGDEGSSNNLIQSNARVEDEDNEQENQETGGLKSRSDDEDCDRTPLRLSVGT